MIGSSCYIPTPDRNLAYAEIFFSFPAYDTLLYYGTNNKRLSLGPLTKAGSDRIGSD